MDPVTAALNLATSILEFAREIYAATPADVKAAQARDWANFIHGLAAVLPDPKEITK